MSERRIVEDDTDEAYVQYSLDCMSGWIDELRVETLISAPWLLKSIAWLAELCAEVCEGKPSPWRKPAAD